MSTGRELEATALILPTNIDKHPTIPPESSACPLPSRPTRFRRQQQQYFIPPHNYYNRKNIFMLRLERRHTAYGCNSQLVSDGGLFDEWRQQHWWD